MARNEFSTEDARNFFRRLVKEGPWAPVYLLLGTERYLIQDAIDRLTRSVFTDGPDDFNHDHFDARENNAVDVISACEIVPMFAAKRVVRVRNIDAWKAPDLKILAHYIDSPAQSTLLILEAESLPRKSKAAKSIHKAKSVAKMGFEPMGAQETARWVATRRARTYHLKISREMAERIVDSVGQSLETLDHALEKIMLYSGAKAGETITVTHDILDAVIVDARLRSVFELTDALTQRNLDEAIRTYRRMRLHGDSPIGAVSMISRELRGMLATMLGRHAGQSDKEIAQWIGSPPWTIKKYAAKARRFTRSELQANLKAAAQTATELTSSRLNDDLHVERLILTICTATARTSHVGPRERSHVR